MSQRRAYSYIRMSTDMQLKGDSIRRQLESSEKYADEHGLDLVEKDRLQDIGISAFHGTHATEGALGRFLTAVRDKKVEPGSYLLVESLDRLSRQHPFDAFTIFSQIMTAGINIVTLVDQRVYSKATGFSDLILSIATMSRAHEESETKSQRVSAAWANKRKNVETRKLTAQCPAWLELSDDKRSFVVNQKRAAVIVTIYENGAGGMGYYSITRRLNQDHIPTFGRSDGWQTSYVAKLLTNRAVLGEFQPHRAINGKRVAQGDPITDYFPSIVDEQLFYRAQSGRTQRQNGGGRKGLNISNLFSGIARCAYCNSRMRFENKGSRPKAGTYLVCDRARRGLDCEKTGWKYEDIEASFLAYVQEIDLASLVHTEAESTKRQELVDNIAALNGRLGVIGQEKERAYELYIKSGSKSDFVAQKLQELDQTAARLKETIQQKEQELVALTADLALFYESKDQVRALVEQMQNREDQDAYKLRSLLSSRLKSIVSSMSVASVGTTRFPPESDPALNHEWEHRRYFLIEFKDGTARAVYPDPNDPTQFAEQITSGDDGETFIGKSI
jgi:DNA invertase Pin-like site-specific DNA recombinase/biopolymer transport protein ExbD